MKNPKFVKYIEHPSKEQIRWGSNDDSLGILEIGKVYEVSEWEEHTWHTKVHLKDFPDKKFNSVTFEVVTKPGFLEWWETQIPNLPKTVGTSVADHERGFVETQLANLMFSYAQEAWNKSKEE